MCLSRTSDHILIKIKMPNPNLEPPAPNQDLKDMHVLCTFKIWNMGLSNTSDHILIKIKMPTSSQEHPASSKVPNQDFEDIDVLCTFNIILQFSHSELKGYGCSLHLQNQDREPKFRSWVYQRPLIISKSRSRCQTPVKNLQCPTESQMRT